MVALQQIAVIAQTSGNRLEQRGVRDRRAPPVPAWQLSAHRGPSVGRYRAPGAPVSTFIKVDFAGTVAANQTQPFAGLDNEIGIVEQGDVTEGEACGLETE